MKSLYIIGVLTIWLFQSCEVDKVTLTEYVYKNESGVAIDFIHFWNGVENKVEVEINGLYSVKVNDIGGISPPPIHHYDSAYILFDKSRYLVYKLDPMGMFERNPYFFDSYEKEKPRKYYYKLTYVLTINDFLNAKEINP